VGSRGGGDEAEAVRGGAVPPELTHPFVAALPGLLGQPLFRQSGRSPPDEVHPVGEKFGLHAAEGAATQERVRRVAAPHRLLGLFPIRRPSLSLPPFNRSIAEQHEDQLRRKVSIRSRSGLARCSTRSSQRRFGDDDIEFAWVEQEEVDQEKQATTLCGYAEGGVLTLNQVREKLGEKPDPNPAANQLMVKNATGYVPVDANLIDKKARPLRRCRLRCRSPLRLPHRRRPQAGRRRRRVIDMARPAGSYCGARRNEAKQSNKPMLSPSLSSTASM
jgi:hypothetical protein